MKAVVMAGGEGTRLRPLTLGRPKPMVPLVNQSVLSHILDLLKRHGITDVIMTLQYLSGQIRDYYGDGSNIGMNIEYSVEDVPLGTAGSVRKILNQLDDTFLVISGDALTDLDLNCLIEFHRSNGAAATMMLYRVPNPLEYGVVTTDEAGRVLRFYEKPGWSEVMSDTVNTGIYVVEPEVMRLVDRDVVCDFSHDLFRQMIHEGQSLYGYVGKGYWTDIGEIETYMAATADALSGAVRLEPLGTHIGGNIWCGGEVEVAHDARLFGPVYLGSGVKIKGGVTVQGPAVIRDNTVVDTGARIERSILWRNSYIGERVEVRGALVGMQCSIKANVIISEGAVVSDNTIIRENAVIQPMVKIWPDKEVEAGATVTTSIIWGSQGRRHLFGRYGVTGMVNVDLTPEFCVKIGAAFGTALRKGAKVVVNREAHNTPRVLKRAVLSGLPSAGVDVLDTATQPIPVTRFYTRHSDASGGIHVRLSPYDNRVVDIKFFGGTGLDLSSREQRSIENVFFREDFRRVYLDEIGQITYPSDVQERYGNHFMGALKRHLWPLPDRYDHVIIDYANASPALVLPDLLTQLKCDVVAINSLVDQSLLFRTRPQWEEDMTRLGSITKALGANFGVRLDVGGERIFLTSNEGGQINGLDVLIAVAQLLFRVQPGAKVGVPVTAPHLFEEMAEKYGGTVRRLRLGQTSLMEAATKDGFDLIGDDRGLFIFPEFTPFPDGMFAIAKIMELTAQAKQSLSDACRERPSYQVVRASVGCQWEAKGRVMRRLREQFINRATEVPDGVQLDADGDWVLILSDPDEPCFWVYAEGRDQGRAHSLVAEYTTEVNALLAE
jgi:mannose-1-phosphate guanylyltransferase/phosphomannomutase